MKDNEKRSVTSRLLVVIVAVVWKRDGHGELVKRRSWRGLGPNTNKIADEGTIIVPARIECTRPFEYSILSLLHSISFASIYSTLELRTVVDIHDPSRPLFPFCSFGHSTTGLTTRLAAVELQRPVPGQILGVAG